MGTVRVTRYLRRTKQGEEIVVTERGKPIAGPPISRANPWISPEGLLLQQDVLARVWDDPTLDVYDHD